MLRQNRMGMTYDLAATDDYRTLVTLVGHGRELVVGVPLDMMNKAWDRWEQGELVQNAFYFMNEDEREFIMTGITSEEWDEMFGEKE